MAVGVRGGRRRGSVTVAVKRSGRVSGASPLRGLRRKLVESKRADPEKVSYVVRAREPATRARGIYVVPAADSSSRHSSEPPTVLVWESPLPAFALETLANHE